MLASAKCGPPTLPNGPDGYTTSFIGHNNNAPDYGVESCVVNVDTGANFSTGSGPHYTQYDPTTRTVVFSNDFVDLTSFWPTWNRIGRRRQDLPRVSRRRRQPRS